MYVYALCVQCQWRPEEGVVSPAAGVDRVTWMLGLSPGSLQEQPVLFKVLGHSSYPIITIFKVMLLWADTIIFIIPLMIF